MLIQLSISNHKSLHQEQEVTFVTGLMNGRGREIAQVGSPVLPVMSIHGANASGKSNVLDAIGWLQSAVRNSYRQWLPEGGVPTKPFAFGSGPKEPSRYEVDFVSDSSRWTYGIEINSMHVLREWLHQYGTARRRRVLFERNGQDFLFGASLSGPNQTIAKLTRPNSLFLSAAAQNGHEGVLPVWRWFNQVRLADPENLRARQSFTTERASKNTTAQRQILAAMKAADFGLTDLEIVENDLPEESKRIIRFVYKQSKTNIPIPDKQKEVRFRHAAGNHSALLDFESESMGTQAWYGLVGPLIATLANGSLLCFDEIDHHLHPLLVEQVVQCFNDPEVNTRNAQLLFTTQRTFDMQSSPLGDEDEPILDRDQIWLTEKGETGETAIVPLSAYKPRRRQNIERAYLQGRFGAVPSAHLATSLIRALAIGDETKERS